MFLLLGHTRGFWLSTLEVRPWRQEGDTEDPTEGGPMGASLVSSDLSCSLCL